MNTTCIRAINHSKESHTRGDLCCCWLFSAKTNPVKIILAVRFTFQFRNRLVKTLIDSWVCRLEGKTETKQFTCKVSNLDRLLKGNWCCKKKQSSERKRRKAGGRHSPRGVLVSSQMGQQSGPPPLMDQHSAAQRMQSKLVCDFSGAHGHRNVFFFFAKN